MNKRGFNFVVFVIVMIGCDNINKQEIIIRSRVLYPQNSFSNLLDSLRPPSQRFSINSKIDTVIAGMDGTLVAIDGDTFINSKGETVAGKIDISLVEVKTPSDIIGSGLQTTAGDNILQTAGMLFIDARSNGEPVQIRGDKPIVIRMSGNQSLTSAKVFMGEFNKEGKINWKIKSGMETDLITLPTSLLDFNYGAWECMYTDEQLKFLQNSNFKNTFIHTSEFEKRMHVFNYYATCPQMKHLDDEIIEIYTSNIQNNLFQADSLVAIHLMNNYRELIDTAKVFEFNDIGWVSLLYRSALQFVKERSGKPLNFEELGINSRSTSQQLMDRSYSEAEATHLLNLYNIREQVIRSRENKNKIREIQSYVFSISDLGWINVDRFLTDQNASESTFTVRINCKDSLDAVAVSLIIPSYSVALNATNKLDGAYSFTRKEEGYRKLPVGKDAIIVAISCKDNKSYFGKQKIKIQKDGQIEIAIVEAPQNIIKKEILGLLSQ